MANYKTGIKELWEKLYGNDKKELLDEFLRIIDHFKQKGCKHPVNEPGWYKDVIVYSLYVDRFNNDIEGLTEKLEYLCSIGISCIWLLPVLDSPMRDAGFDISDFRKIRSDIIKGDNKEDIFNDFLHKAHSIGIKVIFDIAINHTSDRHRWFQEASRSRDSSYRDYYIWSKDKEKYKDARIIFKGIESSNWEKLGDEYYFHRFFHFQPDLNYRNPRVLMEMCYNLLYWANQGLDGFRTDAIPYLWKEEGTNCENLDNTHTIIKIFRIALETVRPNTLLLAEACQKPHDVVKYFGDGDECQAAYHFPLMPQIFKSIACESAIPIMNILDPVTTPPLPVNCQWFTFLRCHDELSLELVYVSEEDRAFIHRNYCHKPNWDFRKGEGVSARISELMEQDPKKIGLAFSLLLSLPGTPVIYYGDEFGLTNDEKHYEEQVKLTGKDDSRYLVRGKIDWDKIKKELNNDKSFAAEVFNKFNSMINVRKNCKCFGRGELKWMKVKTKPSSNAKLILAFKRIYKDEEVIVLHNLSNKTVSFFCSEIGDHKLEPYAYLWMMAK